MKREIAEAWVAALRSGDYKQGCDGWLCRTTPFGDEWCCLGVLIDISQDGYWTLAPGCTRTWRYDGRESFPSSRVLADVGLDKDSAFTLTQMNDAGKSFAEIADWIEQNLLGDAT